MIPILIRKDPNRWEHLPYDKSEFQSVIDSVNLSDILDYIISAIDEDWSPKSYWSIKSKEEDIFIGKLQWVIYSYLVHKGLLIVEDRYFGYNKSRTEKYTDRYSYYNPLEKDLYKPIMDRMVDEKYLTSWDGYVYTYYKLGPVYWRGINLERILDEV
jgi:hypothetical protein